MRTNAVVLQEPKVIGVRSVELTDPGARDIVVEITHSGISAGTERLLWSGEMPPFPGMGYPLVPGYESIGKVVEAGPDATRVVGETVFVPGANCFEDAKALFGGASEQLVTDGDRTIPIDPNLGSEGILIALSATAHHALFDHDGEFAPPDLIIGHGVLGRLLSRISVALGGDAATVHETNPLRREEGLDYAVLAPEEDERRDYRRIIDVSGYGAGLDGLVKRLAPKGEIVLAGFYSQPLTFAFPPAFMREARFRCAAEWKQTDLTAVDRLLAANALSLDKLITHKSDKDAIADAYTTAFEDPNCLKMIIDWSGNV